MRPKIPFAALILMLTSPVSAETCLALMMKVNRVLETTNASKETKDKAQHLRDEGKRQRADGGDCPALRQALQRLGK